jgi:CRISPR-associated protein Csd1
LIINSLYQYYETLLDDQESGVSRPGYSKARVSYCLVLSGEGQLVNIIDLRVERRGKQVPRDMDVPEQVKRSVNVLANFLCDNCTYVLGMGQKNKKENKERIRECFQAFTGMHNKILGPVADEGAAALLGFLNCWDIADATAHSIVKRCHDELSEGGNLVFKIDGDPCYLHERQRIMDAWSNYRLSQESGVKMQCLITGKKTSIACLHPSIKGVAGAQSTGASLVSFNLKAVESFGKEQGFNAPVGEEAAFGYTTALNHLLRSEKHRARIGDATTVFWAEHSTNELEEDLLGALFYPPQENEENGRKEMDSAQRVVRDPQTVKLLHDIFQLIRAGRPVGSSLTGVDPNTNFYILGLAPNASRLAVRFWHVDQYVRFIEKIAQHYRDLSIVKRFEWEPDFISVGTILKETAPLRDVKRVAPLLGGILMRSILTGAPYPMSLYSAIITRIRSDQEVNYARAAMIKACLVRNGRFYKRDEGVLTLALNEENRNTGYMLGRLFALVEKAQEDANPGINATIRDRYFGAASASPGSVFPILLRLAQHHISKAEYGWNTDKKIEGVIADIDHFPAHLSLDEQGQFVLGYYQQRQALYIKKEQKGSAE